MNVSTRYLRKLETGDRENRERGRPDIPQEFPHPLESPPWANKPGKEGDKKMSDDIRDVDTFFDEKEQKEKYSELIETVQKRAKDTVEELVEGVKKANQVVMEKLENNLKLSSDEKKIPSKS